MGRYRSPRRETTEANRTVQSLTLLPDKVAWEKRPVQDQKGPWCVETREEEECCKVKYPVGLLAGQRRGSIRVS
eukprot:6182372-Ditylum_brightwellii.AAC.1